MSYFYLDDFLGEILPLRETIPEENPETSNNGVLTKVEKRTRTEG
jgi:hypothetical protein